MIVFEPFLFEVSSFPFLGENNYKSYKKKVVLLFRRRWFVGESELVDKVLICFDKCP
jgi:hypothetical protein